MTDRELLEMAAKAAGYTISWYDEDDYGDTYWLLHSERWNPLTDDGDALRLAVIVGIDVDQYGDIAEAWKAGLYGFIVEPYSCDPCAATRRAIVRAAAAIGSAM